MNKYGVDTSVRFRLQPENSNSHGFEVQTLNQGSLTIVESNKSNHHHWREI